MEMIMINESKLKVMLTGADLEEFDLEAEDLDYSNTETKRMFWDILGRAKHSVGFDTDGTRVLVQLYPSREGGCEMFITKIGTVCKECATEPPDSSEAPSAPILHYKPSHRSPPGKGRPGAFSFDCLEWLITVCRRLRGIGYTGNSTAYIDDRRRYYLFLEGLDPTGYLPLDEYSFITEYGIRENVESLRQFLGEHGKCLCTTDAVDRLGVL